MTVSHAVVTYNVDELLDFPDSLCSNFPHFQGHKSTKLIPLQKNWSNAEYFLADILQTHLEGKCFSNLPQDFPTTRRRHI